MKLLTILLVLAAPLMAADETRPAYCAGRWYPGDKAQLSSQVEGWLKQASPAKVKEKPLAIIAPHAGYQYSGPTAAYAYACLKGHEYDRVIVLAFSHRNASSYTGIDAPKDIKAYTTPLGNIPIDRKACDELLKSQPFSSHANIDKGEHSLELQLPFLQSTIKNFKLVPLLIGKLSEEQTVEAAQALLPLLDDKTLLVASTDFTHYGPNFNYVPFKDDIQANLKKLANDAARPIENDDYDTFLEHLEKTKDTICGRGPVKLLLKTIAMHSGAQATRVKLSFSSELAGDWTNCVTYQSFVFTPRPYTLTEQERSTLLGLVQTSLNHKILNEPAPAPDTTSFPDRLLADGACFVTLTTDGNLRGCIGTMIAREPLFQSVIKNTYNALRDPRFTRNPVTQADIPNLHYEISYLTPMKEISDIHDIVIGRDGLYIIQGFRTGVLLPQVAYERGWTREKFLEQTCRKAGLKPNDWKKEKTQLFTFTAEVFGRDFHSGNK